MKTNEKIIEDAKEAYNQYFKNDYEEKIDLNKNTDIVLDQNMLKSEVEEMKEDEEQKLKTLELLREKIEGEAKKSYQENFDDKVHESDIHEKMDTEIMYEKMKENQKNLTQMVEEMKKNQLSHK